MTNEKTTWPWDKHAATPEAKRLVARSSAERHLDKAMPKRWWHDMAFGWGGIAVLLLLVGSVVGLGWWVLSSILQ